MILSRINQAFCKTVTKPRCLVASMALASLLVVPGFTDVHAATLPTTVSQVVTTKPVELAKPTEAKLGVKTAQTTVAKATKPAQADSKATVTKATKPTQTDSKATVTKATKPTQTDSKTTVTKATKPTQTDSKATVTTNLKPTLTDSKATVTTTTKLTQTDVKLQPVQKTSK